MKESLLKDQNFKTWWILHQARDVAFRIRRKELSQYGITNEQAAVLFTVKLLNSLKRKTTIGEISKWILRESHSVSKIVTRMEKEGLVEKMLGLGRKKNEVHVIITEKGEQAYIASTKRDSTREMMSCLSKEERKQLDLLLVKIRDKGLQELARRTEIKFP